MRKRTATKSEETCARIRRAQIARGSRTFFSTPDSTENPRRLRSEAEWIEAENAGRSMSSLQFPKNVATMGRHTFMIGGMVDNHRWRAFQKPDQREQDGDTEIWRPRVGDDRRGADEYIGVPRGWNQSGGRCGVGSSLST